MTKNYCNQRIAKKGNEPYNIQCKFWLLTTNNYLP